jgi:hypothetical protein
MFYEFSVYLFIFQQTMHFLEERLSFILLILIFSESTHYLILSGYLVNVSWMKQKKRMVE